MKLFNMLLVFLLLNSFFAKSPSVKFFLLILVILLDVFFISFFLNYTLLSYLIALSIVGGLMVLFSFVIMFAYKQSSASVKDWKSKFVFIITIMIIMNDDLLMSMFYDMYSFFYNLSYSVSPFVSVYLMMIAFLFIMLFIVDGVVKSSSGSMIMK